MGPSHRAALPQHESPSATGPPPDVVSPRRRGWTTSQAGVCRKAAERGRVAAPSPCDGVLRPASSPEVITGRRVAMSHGGLERRAGRLLGSSAQTPSPPGLLCGDRGHDGDVLAAAQVPDLPAAGWRGGSASAGVSSRSFASSIWCRDVQSRGRLGTPPNSGAQGSASADSLAARA